MATISNGYMGAFNGKLGPAVAYTWKGRLCLRAHQPLTKNPRTKQQQRRRTIFGTASKLAASMAYATQIGLRGIAAERQTNVASTFIHLNHRCIDIEGGEPVVDYAALTVAGGSLTAVAFATPQVAAGGNVSVDYRTTGGDSGDYVYLFAYAPELELGCLSLPTRRYGTGIGIALPGSWTGREVHLYGFAWDRDSNASPSEYLGKITVS